MTTPAANVVLLNWLEANQAALAALVAVPSVPSGTIIDFAGNAIPPGYLICYGQAVSRATYPALFAAIGTIWGAGDGSTTFNLPTMQRRVTIGDSGIATPVIGATVGSYGGSETHTLTTAEMPVHNHPGQTDVAGAHTHTVPLRNESSGAGGAAAQGGDIIPNVTIDSGSAGLHSHVVGTNNAGSGSAHSIMQSAAVVRKVIKT